MSTAAAPRSSSSAATSEKLSRVEYGIYMNGQKQTAICSTWLLESASFETKQTYALLPQSQIQKATVTSATSSRARSKKATGVRGAGASTTMTVSVRPSHYLPVIRSIIRQASKNHEILKVPTSIIQAFREAIRVRETVCSWFQAANISTELAESNRRHLHFVQVLRLALNLLLPYHEVEIATEFLSETATLSPPSGNQYEPLGNASSAGETPTSYAEAEADEIDDPFAADDAKTSNARQKTSARDRAAYKRACQLECFFYDVNNLLLLVHQKWKGVAQGTCDAATATITTHFVIEAVESFEMYFKQRSCGNVTAATEMAYAECLQVPVDPSAEYGGTFRVRSAFALAKSLINVKRREIAVFFLGSGSAGVRSQKTSPWTKREDKALKSYGAFCPHPENCDRKEHRHPFHPGILPEDQCRLDAQTWGYDPADLELLEKVFSDSLGPCTESEPCHGNKVEPIAYHLLENLGPNEVTLTAALCVQIFLDVRSILGAKADGLQDLDCIAAKLITEQREAWAQLDSIENTSTELPISAGQCIATNVLHDSTTTGSMRDQKGLRAYLASNPLACSFKALNLRLYTTWNRLMAIDDSQTIKTCLHFYSAMLQIGLLQHPWPDMELLIQIHGSSHLFKGTRPRNLEESLSLLRFVCYCSFDLGEIYPGRGLIRQKDDGKTHGSLVYNYTVLLDLLWNSKVKRAATIPLEDMLNAAIVLENEPDYDIKLKNQREGLAHPELVALKASKYGFCDHIQALNIIADRMEYELPRLEAFDWTALDKICWEMLLRIHTTFLETNIWRQVPYPKYTKEGLLKPAIAQKEDLLLIWPMLAFAKHNEGHREEEMGRLRKSKAARDVAKLEEYEKQAEETREVLMVAVEEMARTIEREGSKVVDVLEARRTAAVRRLLKTEELRSAIEREGRLKVGSSNCLLDALV